MLRAPRGTNDILPPESHKWACLELLLRRLSKIYSFEEIRTPIFEYTELFSRTVGESTDIVRKEMYTFRDKGGRELTLRPEGTAPVARAFLERGLDRGALPKKLFYLGPMFRYEKPQAGRYREFVQYGVEILGSPSAYSDVEVILLAVRIAEELGLMGTTLYINTIGCPKCRRVHREDFVKHISGRVGEFCPDCLERLDRNPLRILDCKNDACRRATADVPLIRDYLCDDCREHWVTLQDSLRSLGLEYTVDPTLVRGFDYYTKTVFELKWPPLGAQDAIIGGGRYDGLIEELGGKPCPGMGFAVGVERLLLAAEKGDKPLAPDVSIDCFVLFPDTGDKRVTEAGFGLLNDLRCSGLSSDFDPLRRSMKAQMKHADRLKAKYVAIIGEEEIEQGFITIRSMEHGWQKQVPAGSVLDFMKEAVSGGTD
ncbi:MAG TPA: histidine--tRNA ligase [Firmicutes bacterium]|nr:histidine--tRNA ligase [Bacillota bacterium]